jgi:hypothetical protein
VIPVYTAEAACQITGVVAVRPQSLPILYCPFFDLLGQFNSADHHGRGSEALQSRHRAKPLLYSPVVLFDGIVQVLAGPGPRPRFGDSPFSFNSASARCNAA